MLRGILVQTTGVQPGRFGSCLEARRQLGLPQRVWCCARDRPVPGRYADALREIERLVDRRNNRPRGGARPRFAAFHDEVEPEIDKSDWAYELRNRLGLTHLNPVPAGARQRYASRFLSVARRGPAEEVLQPHRPPCRLGHRRRSPRSEPEGRAPPFAFCPEWRCPAARRQSVTVCHALSHRRGMPDRAMRMAVTVCHAPSCTPLPGPRPDLG